MRDLNHHPVASACRNIKEKHMSYIQYSVCAQCKQHTCCNSNRSHCSLSTLRRRHAHICYHSRRVSLTISMCALLSTEDWLVSFSRRALPAVPLVVDCFRPGGGSSRGILLPRSGLELPLAVCCGTTSPTKRARGRDMAALASKTADDPIALPTTHNFQLQ